MNNEHHYALTIEWTGNLGTGTSGYRDYTRNHVVSVENKPTILASSDPHFRGNKDRYNPEEMLVAALSSCHMLSYLHLCAVSGVVVTEYKDNATGVMKENKDGSGQFTEITLHPVVKVKESSMNAKAIELHDQAEKLCFIARSVNFPVHHKPTVIN
ncbi:MAG: OsmC family protein [Bacteroidetes bacterium]|nr:OsmC family protein [Bacteroidota bacterium]